VTPTGAEHIADSSRKKGVAVQGGAKSGALPGDFIPDADLLVVIHAWPGLPEAVRRKMVGLVQKVLLEGERVVSHPEHSHARHSPSGGGKNENNHAKNGARRNYAGDFPGEAVNE
jgi:hypothetical protein